MFSKLVPKRMPSTWRLAALQGITIATSIALCLTLAGVALENDLETLARQGMLDDLGEFAVLYEMQGTRGLDVLFEEGRHSRHESVRVVSKTGDVLFENRPKDATPFDWPPANQLRRFPDVRGLVTVEHPLSDKHVLIGRKVLNDGAVLWKGRTDAEDGEYVRHIVHYLWLAGVGAALIALVPVFWYAGQVLRPVRDMIASAQSLAGGAGEERLVASSAVPELKEFATAFNLALDRNSALTSELQAANDHLAHELRTPLARIRGNLEVFHESATDPQAQEAAARGMDEIDRASSLVQTILTVRAGEHNALKLHLESIALNTMLADLIELYAVSAEEKQQVLTLEAAEVTLLVDQQRLTQAITNLLDNALAYTPAGGAIAVSLEAEDDRCVIRVRDSGPGIRSDEMLTIWQRFIRGSASSARTPGMGLGLSLVKAVAHAHGGDAGCSNCPSGGAEFWISLPRQVG